MPGGLVYDVIGNALRTPKARYQVDCPQAAALLIVRFRGHLRIINRNACAVFLFLSNGYCASPDRPDRLHC